MIKSGARLVTDRLVPLFGGDVWFVCSGLMAVLPDLLEAGTGSDCAGAASFRGSQGRVAGPAGGPGGWAERTPARQQARKRLPGPGPADLQHASAGRGVLPWRAGSRVGSLSELSLPFNASVRLALSVVSFSDFAYVVAGVGRRFFELSGRTGSACRVSAHRRGSLLSLGCSGPPGGPGVLGSPSDLSLPRDRSG